MPENPKRKFLAAATRAGELIILIPLAIWGLIQLVEAITSRKQISSFVTEGNIHLHEIISRLTIGIIGVSLAVIAALVIGYETRGKRVRHKRTRPAAIVMVVGVALALSATLYTTKTGKVVNVFRASVSPAQALTKATAVNVDHEAEASTSTSQTIAEESQQPLFTGEEATTSTAPTTYCGCPSSAAREPWSEEEWGEPEREEEEWGEPEEEWEEEEWGEPEEEWEEEEEW